MRETVRRASLSLWVTRTVWMRPCRAVLRRRRCKSPLRRMLRPEAMSVKTRGVPLPE